MGQKVDRAHMRQAMESLGIPADHIDFVMGLPDQELEVLEGLSKMLTFARTMARPLDHEEMRVGQDYLPSGIRVSTMLTNDCGYETAVVDIEQAIPVERYPNIEHAQAGHQAWIEKMKAKPEYVERVPWVAMDVPGQSGPIKVAYPDIFIASEQPEECRKCGARTVLVGEVPNGTLEMCSKCEYVYLLESEDECVEGSAQNGQ